MRNQRIKKIISLEDPIYSLKTFIWLYIIMKFASIIGDKFILYIALNVFIFYAPIEQKYPHFIFNTRMSIKQVVEGIFGMLECLIPRYEEPKKN